MLRIKKEVDLKRLEKFGFKKVEYTHLLVLRKEEHDFACIDIRNRQYEILDLCNLTYNLTYDLIKLGYVEKSGGGVKMKCKECKYCEQIGRSESQNFKLGRKQYFCENPEVYNLKDEHGRPIYNFIGYGDSTIESPLQLKTLKKWCPLKKEEKQ